MSERISWAVSQVLDNRYLKSSFEMAAAFGGIGRLQAEVANFNVQGAQKALPTTDNSASGGFVSILFRWRH
jgi:hypothetical protein